VKLDPRALEAASVALAARFGDEPDAREDATTAIVVYLNAWAPTGRRVRVCVGDAVYEDAEVTFRDGTLYVAFDADDLDDISVPLV
jgi:hypothetical protein